MAKPIPILLQTTIESIEDDWHIGPAIAESTFHHFADYNLNPSTGAPDCLSDRSRVSLRPRVKSVGI
jgi:hypothetical protein